MDKTFGSVDEVLDFAIGKEQEAHDLYQDLATKASTPAMAKAFKEFAQEELGHRAKLERVKAGGQLNPAEGKIQDLKVVDYLTEVEPQPNMSYQDALILAMQAEKSAYRLYTNLGAQTNNPQLQELFQGLAQEEAKHKLRFEVEYDQHVLQDN